MANFHGAGRNATCCHYCISGFLGLLLLRTLFDFECSDGEVDVFSINYGIFGLDVLALLYDVLGYFVAHV